MANHARNPLKNFFRRLFGFPEGEPGSCACSGEAPAVERKSQKKAADRCCEKDGSDIPVDPATACCGR